MHSASVLIQTVNDILCCELLPPWQGGYVFSTIDLFVVLYVYLLVTLLKKLWTDSDEYLWKLWITILTVPTTMHNVQVDSVCQSNL